MVEGLKEEKLIKMGDEILQDDISQASKLVFVVPKIICVFAGIDLGFTAIFEVSKSHASDTFFNILLQGSYETSEMKFYDFSMTFH